RRAEITVEGLNLGKAEWILEWCEPGFREALGDEGEHRGSLGQNPVLGDQRGYASLRIDGQIFRRALFGGCEVDPLDRIFRSGFLKRDMRSQGAGAWRVIQFHHGDPTSLEHGKYIRACWLLTFGGVLPLTKLLSQPNGQRKRLLRANGRSGKGT